MNVAILVTALVAGATAAASQPLVLVDDGTPRCSIVTTPNASATTKRAAKELATYVKRISGADVPIVSEDRFDGAARLDVGLTQRVRASLPDGFLEEEERVLVRSDAAGVLICGGSDRGTLFAVYRFLEVLGCRWLTPDPETEIVPRQSTLVVKDVHLDTKPAFQWRLFLGGRQITEHSLRGERAQLEPWGVKVGLNGLYTPEAAPENGACYYYPAGFDGVHTWEGIITNNAYFEKHPEWFPLLGGKRVPTGRNRQLCVTASGLADEFARNVIRAFDDDPQCRLMSISPNDCFGWCECPECTDLDQRLCGGRTTEQGLARARPFRGDRVFWFANEVAARVAKKHPDKKLLLLAYVNYAEPPDTVRPHPNVIPFVCHYAPADYAHAINDPASEPNRQFNEMLKDWVRTTPNVMIYSYVSKSLWWQLPRPVLRTFAADIEYFYQLGITRYYCQSTLSDWPLDGPLYYVIARLLWDPSADADAIARQWIDGMFGPASEHMAAFYEAVDASVRKTGKPYSDNPRRDVPGLYDRDLLDQALAAIGRAEQVSADKKVRQRVAEVARRFRYGHTMIRALEEYDRFLETGDPEAGKNAVAIRDKAFSYCLVPGAAKRTGSWKINTDIGVLTTGFGDAEEKGGRRCWNSDETGVGDNASGWATCIVRTRDTTRPVVLEMDVWGESALGSILINSKRHVWNSVRPDKKLSGKPQWDTLVFHVPAKLLSPDRLGQNIGFGGGDSQVWIAKIRCRQE